MTDAARIAERYIELWNEKDAAERRSLFEQHWTGDATYVDPLMQAHGAEGICGLVAAVHERFPAFRFSLHGQPDGHGNHVRFGWALGPAGAEPLIRGTDFAVVENGRLKSVVGFLDQVPAGI